MKRSASLSQSAELSEFLRLRLNAYALAASAAGVGMLALAQPAEAKIVYTPTNVTIVGPNGSYNLDLNNDGQIDFTIRNTKRSTNTEWNSYALWDEAAEGNGVECSQIRNSVGYALALARGSKIGAGRKVCRTAGLRIRLWDLSTGELEKQQEPLPRAEVRDQGKNALWMGAAERRFQEWNSSDLDRLRLRNHPQQTYQSWTNSRRK